MPTRALCTLVADAAEAPARLAIAFWAAAGSAGGGRRGLGRGGRLAGGLRLSGPGCSAAGLRARPASRRPRKNRVHLDLAQHLGRATRRACQPGARPGAAPVDIGQGDVPWVVLADPEGNEFCVLEPRARFTRHRAGRRRRRRLRRSRAPWRASGPAQRAGCPMAGRGTCGACRSPSGGGPYLELLRAGGAKPGKNRIHLDVAPRRGDDRLADVSTLLRSGATPADVGQGDVPWTVLADPEGNEFCVLTPSLRSGSRLGAAARRVQSASCCPGVSSARCRSGAQVAEAPDGFVGEHAAKITAPAWPPAVHRGRGDLGPGEQPPRSVLGGQSHAGPCR